DMSTEVDGRSVKALRRFETQLRTLSDESYSAGAQIAGIFGGSKSDEFAAAAERQAKAAGELYKKYKAVGEAVGNFSPEHVERWAMLLDLDPNSQSVEDMAAAIESASRAAGAGS